MSRVTLALALALVPSLAAAQRGGVAAVPDSVIAAVDRAFAWSGESTPGCAVGVAKAGEPVLTRAYGMANLEYGVANTPATIFESGSVAKQFTSAAVALLARDGKLSLDDDVRRWLPEVPDFGERITIRHLLTHTSGLRDQWGLLGLTGNPPGRQVHTLDRILDLVSKQRSLNFRPGEEYLYSNTGYALATIIVQRASGKSLAQFSEERLFKPLGMTDTRWRDDFSRIVKGRATAYSGDAQIGFRQDMPFTNVYGNGGLLTTVGDLLKWNAFLDAPRAELGGRALVEALETRGILRTGRAIDYALGLGIDTTAGRRRVDHSGATAGYRTWLARWPTEQLSIAVLCNSGGANAVSLGQQVARQFLPPLATASQAGAPAAPAAAPALTAAQLARYAGIFRSARSGTVIETAVRDGRLVTVLPGPSQLAPLLPDRFRVPGQGELLFRMQNDRAREVLLVGSVDTSRYVPVLPADTSAAALAALAGTYTSPELESSVTMAVKDGRLVARIGGEESAMRATFRDGFTAPGVGSLVFARDTRGRVTGFSVWGGRIRDVRFVKG